MTYIPHLMKQGLYQGVDTEVGLLHEILDANMPLNVTAVPIKNATVPLTFAIFDCAFLTNDMFINIVPTSFFNNL